MNNKLFDLGKLYWLVCTILAFTMLACGNKSQQESESVQPETKRTSNNSWVSLSDSTKWRFTSSKSFPADIWQFEDGILFFEPGKGHGGGSIITNKKYKNFKLRLDFKIRKGGNSGIKYNVINSYPGFEGKYLGLEYQLLDDKNHPDARRGKNGNRTLASLYDMIPASKDKNVNALGNWNSAKIISDENEVEHWLNGEKVVSYEIGSENYKQLVQKSKYGKYENFGNVEEGHILLQAHGDSVYFKNIEIKKL